MSFVRTIRNLLRTLAAHWPFPVKATLATGQTCYVDLRSAVGRGLFATGANDPAIGNLIENCLRGQNGIFIDGGAHLGSFSLLALHAMRDGEAHAFEIGERVLPCLRLNREVTGSRLVVHEVALGAEAATLRLSESADPGHTHISRGEGGKEREIPVRPLDSFLPEFGTRRVRMIKLDVEGFESQVLQGARELLSVHRPTVVCEVVPALMASYGASDSAMVQYMESLGYTCHELEGAWDRNFVFTPRAG